jgi:hypothetical protein
VKAKTLFWLLIVAALAVGVYILVVPKLQSDTNQRPGFGPKTVVIRMPSPGG